MRRMELAHLSSNVNGWNSITATGADRLKACGKAILTTRLMADNSFQIDFLHSQHKIPLSNSSSINEPMRIP